MPKSGAGQSCGACGTSKGVTMTTSRPTILEVHTQSPQEVIDITAQVESLLGDASGGSCHLYLAHTTAGLMVVTSEAGVPEDVMDALQALTPKLAYRHDSPAHVAAHFLSALVGPSVVIPVRDGRLALGEFQRVVLLEFEGPRRRRIEVHRLAAWTETPAGA